VALEWTLWRRREVEPGTDLSPELLENFEPLLVTRRKHAVLCLPYTGSKNSRLGGVDSKAYLLSLSSPANRGICSYIAAISHSLVGEVS
jgi:hypothetical protein